MSTTTLPNIPNAPEEVKDAIKAYGNARVEIAVLLLCKDPDDLEIRNARAVRDRLWNEAMIAVERWSMRQIRVTAGMTIEHATEALDATRLSTVNQCLRNIIATNAAVLEGGAA